MDKLSRNINSFCGRLWLAMVERVNDAEYQIVPLAIIGFIGYASYYLIWRNVAPTAYENMPVRLIAMLLCLGAMLKNYWPQKIRAFLPLYWYLFLLYIFPFFYTFMLLENNFSSLWVQNSMTGLFFLIVLVDWLSLIILLVLGIILGWGLYTLLSTNALVHLPSGFLGTIFAYIAPIGIAGVFAYGREQKHKEKLQTMQSFGASIAHELRTPLRTIKSGINVLKNCFPQFSAAYQAAKDKNLDVPDVDPRLQKSLPTVLDNVESETEAAFTIIDMLLVKVNQLGIKSAQMEMCSMAHCINEALRRYPFDSDEAELVHWESKDDFTFKGSALLAEHVLFNLLKNALYYIKAAGKGDIQIWLEHGSEFNRLHFKDTGKGIAPSILPRIFDQFFSDTYHGTGIGLAFCQTVMRSFGGDITCSSKEGEFAEFVLSFPTSPLAIN